MIAALVAVTSACNLLEQQSCTEAACLDGATLHLNPADGARHLYAVTLLIDGRRVTCATPDVEPPHGSASVACSSPEVTLSHQPLTTCTETRTGNAVSQSCTPNGKFGQTIWFNDITPSRVVVTLVDASNATFERTIDFEYHAVMPNGPECEPVCQGADVEWVVQ